MNRYKVLSLVGLLLIISASCKKSFLQVQGASIVAQEKSVYDLNTTTNYLNGVYVNFAKDLYSFGSIILNPEITSDNIKPATAATTTFSPHYTWSQQANNSAQDAASAPNMNKVWLNGYGLVWACNFLVEKADQYRSENPSKADDIKAQSLGLRAYINFMMVCTFAQSYNFTADASHPGIPLAVGSDWSVSLSRQSVAEVYNAIIADLNTAIPLFQPGSVNVVYMNRNAAKALLARVYLFKGDFTAAKNMACEVGAALPIMSVTDGYPSKLFTNKETEALFQLNPSETGASLPYSGGTYTGTYTTASLARYFVSPKRYIATKDIATLLTAYPTDLRKAWVTTSGSVINITKYPQGVVPGFVTPTNSYYQTLMRTSEMYLIAAEGYANTGNEDSARYYLNQIRTRAKLPAVTNTITGSSLMDSISTERRKELCFEGLRMFDLLRWKKGVTRTDFYSTVQQLPYPSNKSIAPLPQQDVEGYHLTQNLDY